MLAADKPYFIHLHLLGGRQNDLAAVNHKANEEFRMQEHLKIIEEMVKILTVKVA